MCGMLEAPKSCHVLRRPLLSVGPHDCASYCCEYRSARRRVIRESLTLAENLVAADTRFQPAQLGQPT